MRSMTIKWYAERIFVNALGFNYFCSFKHNKGDHNPQTKMKICAQPFTAYACSYII